MKKVSEHLGQIIVALAAIALLVTAVVVFRAPLGGFFQNIVSKETSIATAVLANMEDWELGALGGSGGAQVFYKLEPEVKRFRSAAPLSEFKEVQVNGTKIDASNYTLTEGSTIVTLTVEYMGTLQPGTYTVTIVSESGSVTFTLTVVDGSKPEGGNGSSSLPAPGKTAEEYTWEEITAIGEAGKADEYFNLGDTKTIMLTSGERVVMEIVAFDADTKADGTGAAGITWLSKNLLATKHVMNSTDTNAGGWEASEMRSWLQTEVYNALPDEVKGIIAEVNKTYYDFDTNSTLSCDDKVWIPSYREMLGEGTYREDSGATYTSFFTNNASRIKYYSGSTASWWLRSAALTSDTLRYISFQGSINNTFATNSAGVALGFCTG